MEIEVNEYVRINKDFRTICIGIGKVVKINQDTIYVKMSNNNLPIPFNIDSIAKHSKELIDLIEVGDYVNGHLVVEISKNAYNQKLVITEVDGKDGAIRHYYLERSIKTVVTHEQFESIEYKVGGENE